MEIEKSVEEVQKFQDDIVEFGKLSRDYKGEIDSREEEMQSLMQKVCYCNKDHIISLERITTV